MAQMAGHETVYNLARFGFGAAEWSVEKAPMLSRRLSDISALWLKDSAQRTGQ